MNSKIHPADLIGNIHLLREAHRQKKDLKRELAEVDTDNEDKKIAKKEREIQKDIKALCYQERRAVLQMLCIGGAGLTTGLLFTADSDLEKIPPDLEKIPPIKVPTFHIEDWQPKILKPDELDIPNEEFLKLAEDFTNEFTRYFTDIYLPQAQDEGRMNQNGWKSISHLMYWAKNHFNNSHPKIKDIFEKTFEEFMKITQDNDRINANAIIEFFNTLLGNFDLFLRPTRKDYFVDLYKIKEKHDASATLYSSKVTVPVFNINSPRLSGNCHPPNGGNLRASFYNRYSPFIMVRGDHIISKYGVNGSTSNTLAKEDNDKVDFPKDYDKQVVHSSIYHEATHALVADLFPNGRATIYKEIKFPLQAKVPFENSNLSVDDKYTFSQCNELAAVACQVAHFDFKANWGLFHLANKPTGESRNPYGLSHSVLMQAIEIATGRDSAHTEEWRELFALCENSALTKEKINLLGQKMWALAFGLLEQIEQQATA